MVEETLPFLATLVAMLVAVPILEANPEAMLLQGLISLALLVALIRTAYRCWRGLVQIFLFIFFFGPLSLVEMALAAPTAFVLSRLISRTRVYTADARSLQLTKDPSAGVSALDKLRHVERSGEEPWVGGPLFSLYVAPRPQHGYKRFLAWLNSTHPPIADRVEALSRLELNAGAQDGSRAEIDAGDGGRPLEQSG